MGQICGVLLSVVLGVVVVFVVLIFLQMMSSLRHHETGLSRQGEADAGRDGMVYEDHLVRIDDQGICLRWYHFPFGNSKRVAFSDIDHIMALKPGVRSGSWRIWATGDFRTWFACDWRRPGRDTVFVVELVDRWRRYGFTVVDSERVKQVLRERNLLDDQT